MSDPTVSRIPASHLVRAPAPERPLRLLEQMRERLRARRYSVRTEQAYVHWVRRFVLFHDRRHPRHLGEQEIAAFLNDLTVKRRVAPSTQNQALHALFFLYNRVLRMPLGLVPGLERARERKRLPVVLSREEVKAMLGALGGDRAADRPPSIW